MLINISVCGSCSFALIFSGSQPFWVKKAEFLGTLARFPADGSIPSEQLVWEQVSYKC